MKILCSINSPTMIGWANAIKNRGHEFTFFDNTKPMFDVFDENTPDIFIGSADNITRGLAKCLKEYSDTLTLFYADPLYNLIEYVKELKDEAGKPDYIFNHSHPAYLEDTLRQWKEAGYKTLNSMRASDTYSFSSDKYDSRWESNLSYIGNYEKYLEDFILPICESNLRIFGNGWTVPQAVGMPEYKNIAKAVASSKTLIDINTNPFEPSDLIFNAALSNRVCFSNNTCDLMPTFPAFKAPSELHVIVRDYNIDKMVDTKEFILNEHTYDIRVEKLFKEIGI